MTALFFTQSYASNITNSLIYLLVLWLNTGSTLPLSPKSEVAESGILFPTNIARSYKLS